ncbi:MAG: hypothetical protein K1X94_15135 [Sandaracinaceae bacterium]|nr:hypothetical protein [Sandaracinaceae bacterium]
MDNNPLRQPLVVYTIVERDKDKKKLWIRIGSAFRNRDGSLNAMLDAVPTNGSLHIRELRPMPVREPLEHAESA